MGVIIYMGKIERFTAMRRQQTNKKTNKLQSRGGGNAMA